MPKSVSIEKTNQNKKSLTRNLKTKIQKERIGEKLKENIHEKVRSITIEKHVNK